MTPAVNITVCTLMALGALMLSDDASAQTMYKFRGASGEWMYTDRPPSDQQDIEVRALAEARVQPTVTVFHRVVGRQIRVYASNNFYAPMELLLELDDLRNVALPPPDQSYRFVLRPKSETMLLALDALDYSSVPFIAYHFQYLPGDPESQHQPRQPYRAPFAVANSHTVSQAYPFGTTHTSADAFYAVDIAMPIGTNIYAARGGTVFEVASTNFSGGLDPEQDSATANLVRILHDDGTYAVYAHLNWNTIRVKPGDIVGRGEYIADSGNTGFSSGPHLHFAVIRNAGMRPESVPIILEGQNHSEVVPRMNRILTAY